MAIAPRPDNINNLVSQRSILKVDVERMLLHCPPTCGDDFRLSVLEGQAAGDQEGGDLGLGGPVAHDLVDGLVGLLGGEGVGPENESPDDGPNQRVRNRDLFFPNRDLFFRNRDLFFRGGDETNKKINYKHNDEQKCADGQR